MDRLDEVLSALEGVPVQVCDLRDAETFALDAEDFVATVLLGTQQVDEMDVSARIRHLRQGPHGQGLRIIVCARYHEKAYMVMKDVARAGADDFCPVDTPANFRELHQLVDRCRAITSPGDAIDALHSCLVPSSAVTAVLACVRWPFVRTAQDRARHHGRSLRSLNRSLVRQGAPSLGRFHRWGRLECMAVSRMTSRVSAECLAELVGFASAKEAAVARRRCAHDSAIMHWLHLHRIPSRVN